MSVMPHINISSGRSKLTMAHFYNICTFKKEFLLQYTWRRMKCLNPTFWVSGVTHLNKRFTWRNPIKNKKLSARSCGEIIVLWSIKHQLINWLKLSLRHICLLYRTIIKPSRTYGLPLWGSSLIQRLQSKALRKIADIHSNCLLFS